MVTAPMSEERLASICETARRRDYQHAIVLGDCIEECGACAVDELVAEAKRARADAARCQAADESDLGGRTERRCPAMSHDGDNSLINDRRDFIAPEAKATAAEPMPDKRLADIGAALTVAEGPTITHELYDEAKRARAALAEMTRYRNNAMAYALREHVPIELDSEIDTDGEELANRIEGELLGPGWDWDDDRTPGLLARTAVAVIRPHLARLTDQAQKARAQLAKHPSQWEVRRAYPNGNTIVLVGMDEKQARAELAENGGALFERCTAGRWREVDRQCQWCSGAPPSSSDCNCPSHCGTHACASGAAADEEAARD